MTSWSHSWELGTIQEDPLRWVRPSSCRGAIHPQHTPTPQKRDTHFERDPHSPFLFQCFLLPQPQSSAVPIKTHLKKTWSQAVLQSQWWPAHHQDWLLQALGLAHLCLSHIHVQRDLRERAPQLLGTLQQSQICKYCTKLIHRSIHHQFLLFLYIVPLFAKLLHHQQAQWHGYNIHMKEEM